MKYLTSPYILLSNIIFTQHTPALYMQLSLFQICELALCIHKLFMMYEGISELYSTQAQQC